MHPSAMCNDRLLVRSWLASKSEVERQRSVNGNAQVARRSQAINFIPGHGWLMAEALDAWPAK